MSVTGRRGRCESRYRGRAIVSLKAKRVLMAMARLFCSLGHVPSVREIMREAKLKSPNTVQYHLRRLESLGADRLKFEINWTVVKGEK